MTLDFTSLDKALAMLEHGLARALPAPGDEELRDACIQRFELSFELSWKMLKRKLTELVPVAENIDGLSYRGLIRPGAEYGIIQNVDAWLVYREKRNITSHTYNADKAAEVFAVIPKFLQDARALSAALHRPEDHDHA